MKPATLLKKRVGNYELGETLGEGTFGKVRKAINIKTCEEFAVKVLDKAQVEEQKMGKQLKREIAIMKMIDHPRIVKFKEVLASKSKIYLVLELVTGGELFELLVKEKGGFSEEKARFFFHQLVEGVQCCHDQGICHRDLKPENLLLDKNNQLKISDFGLSALHNNANSEATLTNSKLLHTTCGSPNYVSPEILDGEGYDGRKADVWSMGVILYVLATGRLAFDEPTMAKLFSKIKVADYRPLPKNISASLRDLISGLLIVDPSKRLSLKEVMAHEWYVG